MYGQNLSYIDAQTGYVRFRFQNDYTTQTVERPEGSLWIRQNSTNRLDSKRSAFKATETTIPCVRAISARKHPVFRGIVSELIMILLMFDDRSLDGRLHFDFFGSSLLDHLIRLRVRTLSLWMAPLIDEVREDVQQCRKTNNSNKRINYPTPVEASVKPCTFHLFDVPSEDSRH